MAKRRPGGGGAKSLAALALGYPAAMYLVPLIVIVVMVLAVGFWSPIFAVAIAAVAFVGFLVYRGFNRGREEEEATPPGVSPRRDPEDNQHGIWGER